MSHEDSQAVSQPGVQVSKRPPKRHSSTDPVEEVVTKAWTVAEIIAQYPQATEAMAEYGLHCFGCSANAIESLEEGCLGHGFSDEDITNLVDDINHIIASQPARLQVLTITKAAAEGVKEIAETEGEQGSGWGWGLAVQANKDGSFYMEFKQTKEEGDKEFMCAEVPEVKIWASVLTLQRIGGAVIDVRDGKFKLDFMGEDCCGNTEKCGCR